MKLEYIIEGLNRHIDSKRKSANILEGGHLVLQKIITPNPTFKAYKSYEAILWFVNNSNKYKVLVVNYTAKIVDGQEELVNKELSIQIGLALFNWIGSESYNQVLTGIFKGVET